MPKILHLPSRNISITVNRHLLFLFLAIICCTSSNAQFRYVLKDTGATYTALSGGTSVNLGYIWDEEDFGVSLPFTWKMDSTITLNQFDLALATGAILADASNPYDVNGFLIGDFDMADRGFLTGMSSLSPISYLTVGTTPNRIFKIELASAGFYSEMANYNTNQDYFNLQIWIYEGTNIVEFRYGPSQITNAASYYQFGGSGPLTGYISHLDGTTTSSGAIYYLTQDPTAPGIDSLKFPVTTFSGNQLYAWPSNGTVYRFIPRSLIPPPCLLPKPVASFVQDTTIGRVVQFRYTGTTVNMDSLIWDFGDGQKYKIGGNYSTPVSHIFSSNGRRQVCVQAYNRCQSDTACEETQVLSAGSLAALGNVQVYPNPAGSFIQIDGMEQGGKATLYSITGQQMLSVELSSPKQKMDISGLAPGNYLLLLTDKNRQTAMLRISRQ